MQSELAEQEPLKEVQDTGVRSPSAQTAQSTLPTSALLYLPAAQSEHALPDNPLVDLPSGQTVQLSKEEDPKLDVNPAAQSVHAADPKAEEYLPNVQ